MAKKGGKRHTPVQIVGKLREAEALPGAGKDVAAVVQALGIGEPAYHRWRNQYGWWHVHEARGRTGTWSRSTRGCGTSS